MSEENVIPETTDTDLEGGIFNMVISLTQYHISKGYDKRVACEKVAVMLENLSAGLRQQ